MEIRFNVVIFTFLGLFGNLLKQERIILSRKYRESQTDWFGKRGIPWHVTVATKREGDEMQILTFVHIFKPCNQDNCAVLAVMADVIRQLYY